MKKYLMLSVLISMSAVAADISGPMVANILNSNSVTKKIIELRKSTYLISSVKELSVNEDDGSQAFSLALTPSADNFQNCTVKVRVRPYQSAPERASIESTDCPKKIN